jgi:serine/threonine protein kinase
MSNRYTFIEPVKHGAFGIVYKAQNRISGETVAIKMDATPNSMIRHEVTILNYLYKKTCRVIPPVHWYGDISGHLAMAMPYYSRSLADCVQDPKWKRPTILFRTLVAMVNCLRHIHRHWIIHRDIKPANFMLNEDELILIDFGMATFYTDDARHHICETTYHKEHIIGSPAYASIHVHDGVEPTRRDDLISAVYIVLTILCPSWKIPAGKHMDETELPVTHRDTPKNRLHAERKQLPNIEKSMITDVSPDNREIMLSVVNYLYQLSFTEMPDYDYIISKFDATIKN